MYRFDAVSKSDQHARLYQKLLRYQGITLQLHGIFQKQLKFHG